MLREVEREEKEACGPRGGESRLDTGQVGLQEVQEAQELPARLPSGETHYTETPRTSPGRTTWPEPWDSAQQPPLHTCTTPKHSK